MSTVAEKDMKNFRANLEVLCSGKHAQIAEKAGIARVHLSRIIHGHSCPSLDIAANLARALGVSLDSLMSKKISANVA